MVLEDVDNPPPPDGFGHAPSQEASLTSAYRFDSSHLAKPVPILGPLVGFGDAGTRARAEGNIKFAQDRLGRPLTPSETQALAAHFYKMHSIKSYFAVFGIAAGAARWHATMATNAFPFYKPEPGDVNPNRFFFVKAPFAQFARHCARFAMYTTFGYQLGRLAGTIVGSSVAARDTERDPALVDFTEDFKRRMANDIPQRGRSAEWERERVTHGQLPPHAGAPKPWGPWSPQKAQPNPAPTSDAADDMSPTAGGYDGWSSLTSDSSGGSAYSSSTAQDNTRTWPDPARRESQNPWNGLSPRSTDQDDASPTGGLFQDEVQNQSQSRPGESAWERLRRGAGPPAAQRPRPTRPGPLHEEHGGGSTLGDSFAFAETDQERRLAQEKAQREFDERIERERQGKDFDEGHEKRW